VEMYCAVVTKAIRKLSSGANTLVCEFYIHTYLAAYFCLQLGRAIFSISVFGHYPLLCLVPLNTMLPKIAPSDHCCGGLEQKVAIRIMGPGVIDVY
jgi:hypothetical protein